MTTRVLLAGVLGGAVLFFWGAVSHDAISLGRAGIKELPNEPATVAALHATIQEPGFYLFPSVGLNASREQQKAAMAKARGGAFGLLIYHPSGAEFVTPRRLTAEFFLNFIQALIAAWLLACAAGTLGYASRVGFVLFLGVLVAISTNIEYWNWYSFPSTYTAAAVAIQIIGFFLAGLVLARIVHRTATS